MPERLSVDEAKPGASQRSARVNVSKLYEPPTFVVLIAVHGLVPRDCLGCTDFLVHDRYEVSENWNDYAAFVTHDQLVRIMRCCSDAEGNADR